MKMEKKLDKSGAWNKLHLEVPSMPLSVAQDVSLVVDSGFVDDFRPKHDISEVLSHDIRHEVMSSIFRGRCCQFLRVEDAWLIGLHGVFDSLL